MAVRRAEAAALSKNSQPLHLAVTHGAPTGAVLAMLAAYPDAAQGKTGACLAPMHSLMGASVRVGLIGVKIAGMATVSLILLLTILEEVIQAVVMIRRNGK